jgi:hypothetical protein
VPGMTYEIGGESPDLGPHRGNPTSKRQGRGPEFTGRLADGWLCRRASVRAGLKQAIDALWLQTRVKRHRAFLGWGAGLRQRCPVRVGPEGGLAT